MRMSASEESCLRACFQGMENSVLSWFVHWTPGYLLLLTLSRSHGMRSGLQWDISAKEEATFTSDFFFTPPEKEHRLESSWHLNTCVSMRIVRVKFEGSRWNRPQEIHHKLKNVPTRAAKNKSLKLRPHRSHRNKTDMDAFGSARRT